MPAARKRTDLSEAIIASIRRIPKGRIATYGSIARQAGNPRAARQVARVLHACSRTENLPWHRVINSQGRISLPRVRGYERQKRLLIAEAIVFGDGDRVDLERFT